jgi:Holliday junction resolvase RusA-like endonuclease
MQLDFIVWGDPKGKGRPCVTKRGFAFTPLTTVSYENLIKTTFTAQFPEHIPITAHIPLKVRIEAYFHPSKSLLDKCFKTCMKALEIKKKDLQNEEICRSLSAYCDVVLEETRHTTKPDTDNIAKVVMDSLNHLAYEDDASICELEMIKIFSRKPRIRVIITWG